MRLNVTSIFPFVASVSLMYFAVLSCSHDQHPCLLVQYWLGDLQIPIFADLKYSPLRCSIAAFWEFDPTRSDVTLIGEGSRRTTRIS